MGLMDRMMDRMIGNMSVQEKEEMMLKMMPLMMKDVDMLEMIDDARDDVRHGAAAERDRHCHFHSPGP
jgi:hypothetical protein